MKAIRFDQHGGPGVLRLATVETPAPKAGEVRVKLHAIGVNFIDTYHRTGLYPVPLPSGLGQEGAGIVDAVGEGVTRFQVGDRIAFCSGPIGAYAESHVAPANRAVKLPEAIPFEIAAASLLKGMTARYLLRKTFPVQHQHVVLIHAAAGGVGQIAVQWARHLGATVIATVGNEAKAEIAKQLGAHHALVTGRDDVAKRVREITNGIGVDVVYDGVGRDAWEASLDSLKTFGMMVNFGNASGPVPPTSPIALMQKGSLYLTRPTLAHHTATPQQVDENAADLFEVIGKGAVKIAPPTRYALADAAQAHRDLEARKTTGSLVLTP